MRWFVRIPAKNFKPRLSGFTKRMKVYDRNNRKWYIYMEGVRNGDGVINYRGRPRAGWGRCDCNRWLASWGYCDDAREEHQIEVVRKRNYFWAANDGDSEIPTFGLACAVEL